MDKIGGGDSPDLINTESENYLGKMEIESILKKLRYREAYNSQVVNPPEELAKLIQGIKQSGEGKPEFTLLFIRDNKELTEHFEDTIEESEYDSVFWVVYPKKSSKIKTDVTRDTIWESIKPMGYRPVSMVSINDTWSAMRVRPVVEV